MFTGITKKLSSVEGLNWQKGSLFVTIKKPKGWKIQLGNSIAINGICSTVRQVNRNAFQVEYMPETIEKTTAGLWKKGSWVNLEKSLGVNDLLDGHLVQGHVDTVGEIKETKQVKQSKVMKISLPAKFQPFVADKGSISVDGISLTVVEAKANWFSVSLVSYTLENTNLGKLKKGDKVNIETDVLAKYLDKLLKSRNYAKKK